jgi:multidrug efflux system membrane fusion protein
MITFKMSRSVLLCAALTSVAMSVACGGDKNKKQEPKIPVVVAIATTGTVPITLPANGTVEPIQSVALQARVAGPVVGVYFAEGDEVREGQILFQIDSQRYQSTLASARAVLARDRATASAAKNDAARYASLVAKGYVTQSQTEQQRAVSDAMAATVSADEAAVKTAEIDVGYTTVRAPIAGKTGNLNVRVGNQVNGPTGTPLVTINAVTPINVRFSVPERSLPAVRAARESKKGLNASVRSSDVTEHGEVMFVDNSVDSVSGTVSMKARFPNTDRRLWPGAFVPLTLTLGEMTDVVLIPSVAVQQGPSGAYVFMPDSAGKVKQVPISVDRVVGESAVITKGVVKGDQVVVDGQSRLFAGAEITISKKPAAAPALSDSARAVTSTR